MADPSMYDDTYEEFKVRLNKFWKFDYVRNFKNGTIKLGELYYV